MTDKIKEKQIIERLANARLLLIFTFVSIAGLIGWIYSLYEKNNFIEVKLGFILLLFCFFGFIITITKINSLVKKLK